MKWLSLLVLLTISLPAFSEPAETELRKLLRDYNGFSATFMQQVTDSEGKVVHNAKGSLKFKQPGQFEWRVTEPDEELLVSNGQTLWWYNPFLEQVTLFNASEAVAKTPFALLVSNRDEVWNRFTIEQVESGFVIVPKKPDDSAVLSLALVFDDYILKQILITDRTRQVSHFTLNDHQFKQTDYPFNFVVPDDVDVDDQR